MARRGPWLVLLLLLVACELPRGTDAEARTDPTPVVTTGDLTSTTLPAATTTVVSRQSLDARVVAAAAILQSTPLELSLAVWAAQTVLGAGEPEHYDSVEAMARHASAVVVGEVVGRGPVRRVKSGGRTIVFESLQVEVLDTLAGTRHLEPGDHVRVEMLAAPNGAKGRVAVIFLRCNQDDPEGHPNPKIPVYEAGVYRLIGSQGVFVDRGDGIPVNPITEALRLAVRGEDTRLDLFILGDTVPEQDEQPVAAQARRLTMAEFLRTIIAAGWTEDVHEKRAHWLPDPE